jgi:hypothetical protein
MSGYQVSTPNCFINNSAVDVLYAQLAQFTQGIVKASCTELTSDGTVTVTAQQILNGCICLEGSVSGGTTLTLPSAANLIEALNQLIGNLNNININPLPALTGNAAGTAANERSLFNTVSTCFTFPFVVNNQSGGLVTLSAGAGMTLNGALTVVNNGAQQYKIIVTSGSTVAVCH